MAKDDAPAIETNDEKRQPRPDDPCACGEHRLASGRCSQTGLWPRYVWRREGQERFTLAVKCPFACPFCGHPLEWHGGCYQCHGSATPSDRETWTFPGDRYERVDDWHWEKIDGPHKACTPAENKAGFAAVRAILTKAVSPDLRTARGLPAVDPAIRAHVERTP